MNNSFYDIVNQILLNYCSEKNDFGGNFSHIEKEKICDNILNALENYKPSMFPLLTYYELEELLKIAVKLPSMSIKYVAQETGLNPNGLYNWSSGYSHLGPERINILVKFIREKRSDILPSLYIKYLEKENNKGE